ncbi:MAG: lytic transglycosylase domain-containing protein [Verrucomicrobiota bacterium]
MDPSLTEHPSRPLRNRPRRRGVLGKVLLAIVLLALVAGGIAFSYLYEMGMEELPHRAYDKHIAIVAREYPIDPLLVRAVIWRESRFNPDAVGDAKERGLMQVTPIAAQDWVETMDIENFHLDQLFDPYTNIRAGSFYLSRALGRWQDRDDPIPFALAEYNAGRSRALKWVDTDRPRSAEAFRANIDFPTTAKYIDLIMDKHQEYREDTMKRRWELWLKYYSQRLREKLSGEE